MKVDVYEGNHGAVIYVPADADPAKLNLPVDTNPDYLKVKKIKENMDVHAGDKRIAIDSDKVLADINNNGYSLDRIEVNTSISTGNP